MVSGSCFLETIFLIAKVHITLSSDVANLLSRRNVDKSTLESDYWATYNMSDLSQELQKMVQQ
jgi:hypothetical protein